jgi:hypothetical protein
MAVRSVGLAELADSNAAFDAAKMRMPGTLPPYQKKTCISSECW